MNSSLSMKSIQGYRKIRVFTRLYTPIVQRNTQNINQYKDNQIHVKSLTNYTVDRLKYGKNPSRNSISAIFSSDRKPNHIKTDYITLRNVTPSKSVEICINALIYHFILGLFI
jgi:hypothetical protein